MQLHTHRNLISTIGLPLFAITLQAQETKPPVPPQKIVEQGIAIEFTAEPLVQKATTIRAAEDVNIKFKVTDTTTGTPVKGLGLSAWISMRPLDKASEPAPCREKIQSYLTDSQRTRPEVDLNSYYVLALNKSPDISVIESRGAGTYENETGARFIPFAPAGRYGFVLNTKESIVNIFDAASNRMLHEVNVGKSPDQIMFSNTFADATRRVSGFEENENVYTANSIQSLHARHNDGHCN